ncbi:hypothetical protein [Streptomyces sp. NPDC056296]|uniref:hypothetical protein n=1 Tax=Streptomyces sp. NPDC056296 TaxID=3345775 RepID=UPI0035E2F7E5
MKADGVTVYTAIAGGQQATGALTALGDSLAERQSVPVTVREVVPFPDDEPKGTGLASAAVTAVLQFGIGTLDGNFWLTSLGTGLGMAALAVPFLGLESLCSAGPGSAPAPW